MRSKFAAGLVALMMLTAASGARADAQYAKRLFAGNFATQGKSCAYFVRRYDAAHLAKHPQEKVSAGSTTRASMNAARS